MKPRQFLGRLEEGFLWLNRATVVLMMMLMAALVFANVVSRYLFAHSVNWSEEVARYLMVWITFLGAGLAMREGQHVAIEYVQGLLPPRLLPWWRGAVALIILAFLALLTVIGFQFADFAGRQRTPVLGWSKGAMYLAIPIGAMVFGLHLIFIFRSFVTAGVMPEEEQAEHVAGGAA